MNDQFDRNNEEISMQDILSFLMDAWKTVAIATGVGALFGFVYFLVTPYRYEAIAQIRMAQISLSNPANPFGTPVEDPSSLIARMQMPTNYDPKVIETCNYQNKQDPATSLSRSLKFSLPKGLLNVVEIKVIAESSSLAKNCASAVVEQITEMQSQFARPFVEEAKIKLAQDNERIEAARRLVNRVDQNGGVMSAAYLSARDEISYFLTDREKMIDLINSAAQRGTRLVSPIFAPEKAVAPKGIVSLVVGIFAGLIFGLGISLIRLLWCKRRMSNFRVHHG